MKMVSAPRTTGIHSDEDRHLLVDSNHNAQSGSALEATSDETLEQQIFIDMFYGDIEHSIDSIETPSQSSIAADGCRTDHSERGTVASDSTIHSDDMSRASTQVTENKGSVKSDQTSIYDVPSLRVVRAIDRLREDDEDMPSWARPPPRPQYRQQRAVTAPPSRRKKKHEDRIVFVLGLIGLVFFGLFCGILILLIVSDQNGLTSYEGQDSGLHSQGDGYSTTAGVVRLVDDDNYYTEYTETESPTSAPSKPEDPLLSSLLRPQARPSICQRSVTPPPPLPGKKGIGLPLREDGQNLTELVALDPYWSYSWGLERHPEQPDDIEFVPMAWGGNNEQQLREKLLDLVWPQIQAGTVKRLMGFNEPDRPEQANMEVEEALRLWPNLESLGLPLVSPSCAHPENQWMSDFMRETSLDCRRVDWVGVHWYGNANFDEFRHTMLAYYQQYNRPLLITEFAPVNWNASSADEEIPEDEIVAFLKQAIPWLEKQSWVAGYSWFSFTKTKHPGSTAALFDTDGGLTQSGMYYASVRTETLFGKEMLGASLSLAEQSPLSTSNCAPYHNPQPLPGKRGVALAMRSEGSSGTWFENFPKLLQLEPYWHHSWRARRITGQPQDMEFVPMVWNINDTLEETLRDHISPYIPSGEVKRVLGFQTSNITVEEALAEWPKLEALDIPLVSPSGGLQDPWLENFMGNVTAGCLRVDWIATHYYGPANFTAFRDDMVSLYNQFQRPILITEMAVTDPNATSVESNRYSSAQVLEFMKEALPWLEGQDWIAGYAWFSFRPTSPKGASSALHDDYYNLTDCGKYYLSVTNDNPLGMQ